MSDLFSDLEPKPKYTQGQIIERDGRMFRVEYDEEDPVDSILGPSFVPIDRKPEDQGVSGAIRKIGKPKSPTAALIRKREAEFRKRTYELYRENGYEGYQVGFYSSVAQKTFDLYGLFDLETYNVSNPRKPIPDTIGVQFTSRDNLGAHITKMFSTERVSSKDPTPRRERLLSWLKAGRRVEVLGWYQEKLRGPWFCEIREITLATYYDAAQRWRRKT